MNVSPRQKFRCVFFGLALVLVTGSVDALSPISLADVGGSLSDIPPCKVEDDSTKAHPPLYPNFLRSSGIKGTAILHVSLEQQASGAEQTVADDTIVSGLQVKDLQVKRSTRNRDLDRVALETARRWNYACPFGVPESQRWARVEIVMDQGPSDEEARPLPRFAMESFPGWLEAMLLQSTRGQPTRDDHAMPDDEIESLASQVRSNPAFKKDEVPKPFAMYATWNDRERQADMWWFSDERTGRANAAVFIKDNYATNTRTYAVRCESSRKVCMDFERWLELMLRTWHPMAEWY